MNIINSVPPKQKHDFFFWLKAAITWFTWNGGCWGFTTVPVTKTIRLSEWVHSRRYCNTGYDQSQGRRPSTLKCIGPISKGDIERNHPSEINPNSDSRSRSDGRSRRFVQYTCMWYIVEPSQAKPSQPKIIICYSIDGAKYFFFETVNLTLTLTLTLNLTLTLTLTLNLTLTLTLTVMECLKFDNF